jgi:predicted dehydrogenase
MIGKTSPTVQFLQPGGSSKMRLPPVRVAMAGAGRFAHQHLKVLASLENVSLVGISNRGKPEIAAIAQQYGIGATFADFEQMLDVTQPDAAFVVVSHLETVRVASACMERGIPCLIEKPAGLSSLETEGLAALAEAHHCLNMVGVNRRYWSTIHTALTTVLQYGPLYGIAIDAPEAIHRIRARRIHDPRILDLWLIADTIHAIDLFRCAGGEPTEIQSLKSCWTESSGDSFTAIFRLSHNCLGTFISHLHAGEEWSATFYGHGVRAMISLSSVKGQICFDSGEVVPIPVDPIDLSYKSGLYAQDRAFVHAVATEEKLIHPASDLADATRTMRLIEQIGGYSPELR